MAERAPRLLFVPVSGEFGMGEYARALAIADGARSRWPDAAVHFIVSRRASYAGQCPYPATLLESSPTFHSAAVAELIGQWRPDVVIFDNAGRTAQLRAARHAGARVVYVSARPRQRRKAFRLRWMQIIDEHWIAYPEFIAGPLGWFERAKLRLLGRPRVRYLDVVFARAAARREALPAAGPSPGDAAEAAAQAYVLVVPGGGTGHPGGRDAPGCFLEAARLIAAGGTPTVCVGAPPELAASAAAAGARAVPPLRIAGRLPQAELALLMRGARLIVANGGSTLLQGIAAGKPCVGVPIAKDQAERIRRCMAAGVAVCAPLDATAIARTAAALLRDPVRLEALGARTAAAGLQDGVTVAVQALGALLPAA